MTNLKLATVGVALIVSAVAVSSAQARPRQHYEAASGMTFDRHNPSNGAYVASKEAPTMAPGTRKRVRGHQAPSHSQKTRYARSGGACDGIHRCKCGSTQASYYGLPRIYNGHNLWRAVEWKRAFPQTIAAPGTVLYQQGGGPSGHVSRIVSLVDRCKAVVADDRGEYVRDICSRGAVALAVR